MTMAPHDIERQRVPSVGLPLQWIGPPASLHVEDASIPPRRCGAAVGSDAMLSGSVLRREEGAQ